MFLTFAFMELLGKASILKLSAGSANPWAGTILFSKKSLSMCIVTSRVSELFISSAGSWERRKQRVSFTQKKKKQRVWIGVTFTFISTGSSTSSPSFKIWHFCFYGSGFYLKRAIAKDRGENWRREVGDDGQQDCHASCWEEHAMWFGIQIKMKIAVTDEDKDRCYELHHVWCRLEELDWFCKPTTR